jgi:transcriptional regulator with XRE-family HTH domain
MITNERQLQITRARIERFELSLAAIEAGSLDSGGLDPLLQAAQKDAIADDVVRMRREVEDYERLRSGAIEEFELASLADLPTVLIRARIAAGLTQKDLAERVSIKEQQVQRYEASLYEGASFARIAEIASAVGLRTGSKMALLRAQTADALMSRLALLGLTETFVRRRLAPQLGTGQRAVGKLLDRVRAIFGWEPAQLEVAAAPREVGAALARFKMPRGRDERSAAAYTAYAYHLAAICARAMRETPRQPIPTGWAAFRTALLARYESLDLRSTLAFAWDLGVVVLPLRDPGAFHGACWRIGGINVVILKQATAYPARWLFDLIHELFHCGQEPELPEFSWVEEPELSETRRSSREEQHAMWFAGQVGLAGQAEELVALAIQRSGNFLPRLKQCVVEIAAETGVSRSYLANYLAYRLSLQDENWWGAAANLQERDGDPFVLARDIFFERFDFSGVDEEDVELLALALDDETENG